MIKVEVKSFTIKSGSMVVTDPTYTPDAWCQAKLKVACGKWDASLQMKGHTSHSYEATLGGAQISKDDWRKSDQEIGIDSGFLGLFDEEVYKKAWKKKNVEVLLATTSQGVVCDSGHCDDNFNLYIAKDSTGLIIGVKVQFIY